MVARDTSVFAHADVLVLINDVGHRSFLSVLRDQVELALLDHCSRLHAVTNELNEEEPNTVLELWELELLCPLVV